MEQDTRKTLAALSSVVWSALLTVMKFVVGLATGSLGILSEALHSALDLLAAGGTLFAVRVAAKPGDEDHPYGHGKVENLMALGETLLLLATSFWVIREAVERLSSDDPAALHVVTSVYAFAVVVISLVVDINRAAMLKRVAKETKSAALEADAAHFSTDIWSSAAVLLGITGASLSGMTVEGSWLHWLLVRADVFASLVVAILILCICKELGMKAVDSLMDKADDGSARLVRHTMETRMPAYPLSRLRIREVGSKPYVDMVVSAPKDLHVDTAHKIADAIEQLVAEVLPGAETMVHVQPEELEASTPELLVRRIALTHRFGVHGLVFLHADQGFVVFADLELPPDATLDVWSVAIEAFRNDVRRYLQADRVVVHVEPDVRQLRPSPCELDDAEAWKQQVRRAMIDMGAPLPLSIELYTRERERLCIVTIPPELSLSVQESHVRLTLLDRKLKEALPPVARIVTTYR